MNKSKIIESKGKDLGKAEQLCWENFKIEVKTMIGDEEITEDLIEEVWQRNVEIVKIFFNRFGKENCYFVSINGNKVFQKDRPEDIRTFEADYIIVCEDKRKIEKLKGLLNEYKKAGLDEIKKKMNKIMDFLEKFIHMDLCWV